MSNVISFKEAHERKKDPQKYAARKVYEAIDQQVRAKAEAEKPLLIGSTPELDSEWDEDAGRYVPTITAGPLTRFFSNRDPGDENT
jgi:hypothetical protein